MFLFVMNNQVQKVLPDEDDDVLVFVLADPAEVLSLGVGELLVASKPYGCLPFYEF